MFRYTVSFWDTDEKVMKKEKGIVSGTTYGTAADKVVDYYGESNLSELNLYELESIICDEELRDVLVMN